MYNSPRVREPKSLYILLILLIACVSLAVSCANFGRWTQVFAPEEVTKSNLSGMAYELTPEYEFKVNVSKEVFANDREIRSSIDAQFKELSQCYGIKDNGWEARKYMIAVVDGTFKCEYHRGKCNGEFDPDVGLIIVSYRAFNRKGILPLLKHEWAHAYGILNSDHGNLKTVKECTTY